LRNDHLQLLKKMSSILRTEPALLSLPSEPQERLLYEVGQVLASHVSPPDGSDRAIILVPSMPNYIGHIISESDIPVFAKDLSMKYILANSAMCQLLRVSNPEEVLGRTDDCFMTSEAAKLLEEQCWEVFVGGPLEIIVNKYPGQSESLLLCLAPYLPGFSEVIGAIGILLPDIGGTRLDAGHLEPGDLYPSKAMKEVLLQARLVALAKNTPVLLLGESGSGKDYLAQYIHEHSSRQNGPYFKVDCATIAREVAESELFGHTKGAYTGAHEKKQGQLEQAGGGTLLLNEIGELPLALQSKLLTFLDSKEITPVGGTKKVKIDARLIAATHRDLGVQIAERQFMEPLFHRLDVFRITVPPLRERIEDISVLVDKILVKLAREMELPVVPDIDLEALVKLHEYDWPGNVRELANVLERAVVLSAGSTIRVQAIDFASQKTPGGARDTSSRSQNLDHEISSKHVPSTSQCSTARSVMQLTDDEFRRMYTETCVKLHKGELKGDPGSATAISIAFGCARETISRRIKRVGCPGVKRSGISPSAKNEMVAQVESWLTQHGFECKRATD
jgi:DNA-binding NtrC family response regulator